jgi:hypothetical protein
MNSQSNSPSVEEAGTAPSIPEWFLKKRSRVSQPEQNSPAQAGVQPQAPSQARGASGARSRRPVVIQPVVIDEGTLYERARRWVVGPGGRSFGLSFLVHLTLMLALSFSMVHGHVGNDLTSTFFSMADGEVAQSDLDQILDQPSLSGGAQTEAIEVPVASVTSMAVKPVELSPQDEVERTLAQIDASIAEETAAAAAESKKTPGKGKTIGSDSGKGRTLGGFAMPEKGNVVTRGSFTAWTVPSDPLPFKRYLIVIQIDWPEGEPGKPAPKRGKGDVTGMVLGTDGYEQQIERHGHFIPKRNQIVIPVPGAERNVRDLIRIHSKSLNESQELLITF